MQEPKERIPKSTGWVMIGTAIFLDLLNIIPGLNIIVDVAYIMLFPAWFYLRGASFTKNPAMLKTTVIAFIIGFIPFLSSIIPELSGSVIKNVRFVQDEDRRMIAKFQRAQAERNRAQMEMQQASVQSEVIRHTGNSDRASSGATDPSRQNVNRKALGSRARAKIA